MSRVKAVVDELSAASSREAPAPYQSLADALADLALLDERTPTLEDAASANRERRGSQLSVAIVSVPDPRQGHMAVYFDQAVDALRRAVGAAGFQQTRFSIPWSNTTGAGAQQADTGGGREELGWFVFAREKDVVITILVAESPASGVAPSRVREALSLVERLEPAAYRVGVLGPFFSGSAEGLGATLRQWADTHPRFSAHVITGTATGVDVGRLVHQGEARVAFRRTIADDQQLLAFTLGELSSRYDESGRPARVALLSEFDTSFGALLGGGRVKGGGRSKLAPATGRLHRFTFPSRISELRAARTRQSKKGVEGAAVSLRRTLELRLDASEEVLLDVPGTFSDLTPYEQELDLAQEMVRLCRDRIEFLIISATDPVDVLSLAQESRKYCPGLTLVTLGADQLFLHPDLSATLDGTLVASSYPLLFATPPWKTSAQTQPFSSHVAQGFFNAFGALASDLGWSRSAMLIGYSAFPGTPGCPPATASPQLWLTMVASGNYWPLATTCVLESETAWVTTDRALPELSEPHARATGLARTAGAFVLLAACFHLLALSLADSRRFRGFPLSSLLRRPTEEHRALHARYLVGASLSLCVLVALLVPAAHQDQIHARWMHPCFARMLSVGVGVAVLVALGLFALAARDWVRMVAALQVFRAESWRPGTWHLRVGALLATFIAVVMTVLAALWIAHLLGLNDLDREMVLTRILNPIGMSPLAPAFYLSGGYYVWSVAGLRRVHALHRASQTSPLPDGSTPDDPGEPNDERALSAVIIMFRGIWCGAMWPYEVCAVILLIVPGLYFCVRLLPTFEGCAYDWLIKLGFFILYSLVAVSFLHFVLLSWLLRRFLRQLAAHPMVDAYDRIASKVSGSFSVQFRARVPAFEELHLSVYSSQLLATLSHERYYALPDLASYRQLFAAAHDRIADRAAAVQSAMSDLQGSLDAGELERRGHQALYATSRELFRVLRRLWLLRTQMPQDAQVAPGLPVYELLPGGSHAGVPTSALYMSGVPHSVYLWMRMAEDFVAMRVATFILYAIFQLRNLLSFALIAGVLLVVAVSAYPIQPTRFVTVFAWALVLVVAGAGLALIVRMEKNEILSRLGRSKPGSIDINFGLVSQLFVYVVLPVAAVVVNVFPEFSEPLFAWVGPLQQLLP